MPKIIQRFEGKVVKEHPTNIARQLSVGRKTENGICLDDSTVSGNHAVFSIVPSPLVRQTANDVYIEDLGSTNGTIIDGKKINKKRLLRHGDKIKIGQYEFVYVDENQLRMGQTVIIDPEELNN